ncbi:MAG: hypothetical protein CMJ84_10555 [Planctomycetes bacterium]|jgi:hypothetical protein|nr:hypothetical protein [Planctomycetota bacterium]MDP6408608.1 hypothetical protein [Planctomycetota bacterium]
MLDRKVSLASSLALIGLLGLAPGAPRSIVEAVPQASDTCGADTAESGDWDGDPQTPDTWGLNCSGYCRSSQDCKQRQACDVNGDFAFCGCGTAEKYWPSRCCTLVLRPNADGDWELAKWGACPPCPTAGTCTIVVDPNDPGKVRASCML